MAANDQMSFDNKPLQEPNDEKEKENFDHYPDGLPNGLPNTKARKNMPGFMFETKYVMLNFMSLIPPDLFSGHITSSPDSLLSAEIYATDHLTRSHPLNLSGSHSLRKSQSVDTGLHRSYPKLKHIHRLKVYQQHSIDSPASDDNLGYKYRINCDRALSQDNIQTFHPEHNAPHTNEPEANSPQHTDHSFSDIPRSASPNKSNKGLYRMASDISSSGDFSYLSDADDEDEDTSNASSLFSSRASSITCRDGFLDLRRSNNRLSTLISQSEDSDDVDGYVPGLTFVPRHSFDLQDVPEEKEMSISPQGDEEEEEMVIPVDCASGGNLENVRRTADRSKLKLEIPCPPVQLSDILVSLQSELNSEMSELETEYEEVVKSAKVSLQGAMAMATPLTPQSQAAQVLARIGDEVKYKYEHQITEAVNKYLIRQAGSMSYKHFKEIAQEIVDKSLPGWRQVALLLVFGQRVLWSTLQQGNKQVEVVIDYCSQLVSDVAAEFIIKEGGWGSVMNSDPSLSSDTQSSADSPHCILEYFSNLDATQVESAENVNGATGGYNDAYTQSGNTSTGDINDQVNGAVSLQQLYASNMSGNMQTDNTKPNQYDGTGVSLGVDDSHVKQRLQSFGFDLRDRFESESRAESDQQSLDYINYNPDDNSGIEDGKLSANNSDIFVEISDDSPISAEDNQQGDPSNGDFVDWGGIVVQIPQQNMISDINDLSNEAVGERGVDDTAVLSLICEESTSLCNNDVDSLQINDNRSTEEQDLPKTSQNSSEQTVAVGEKIQDPKKIIESDKDTDEVKDKSGELDDDQLANESSEENARVAREDQVVSTTREEWLGSFRVMGVRVAIASLAVLGAGVAIKIATLNR